MEVIRKYLNPVTLILIALNLFQSCTVYYKTPVSLSKAAQSGEKSKLVLADGTVDNYLYIKEKDGRYYGIKKEPGITLEFPIENRPDPELYLRNKSASRNATILFSVVTVGVAAIVLVATTPPTAGLGGDW